MLQRILLRPADGCRGRRAGRAWRAAPTPSASAPLVAALAEEGIALAPPDGINLWLPVVSERAAIVQLAADEIRVAPGSPFLGRRRRPRPPPSSCASRSARSTGTPPPVARALASAAAHTAVPVFALGGR